MLKKTLFFVSVIFLVSGEIYPQCSDAGICILGKRADDLFQKLSSYVSLSYSYGYSGKVENINYNSLKLEGDLRVLKNSRVGLSMPYSFQSGPLGSANGVGDLTVVWTQLFPIAYKVSFSFSAGGKFPTGEVNSGTSLPQSYQSGLGTTDVLLGAGFTSSNFNVTTGYQKPFGRSRNLKTRLKRGDDIYLRTGYFDSFDKLNFKTELILIKRIQKSTIKDLASPSETFIEVGGTDEFQINILVQAGYRLSDNISVQTLVALPVLNREFNLDGLKRTITVNASATYHFKVW